MRRSLIAVVSLIVLIGSILSCSRTPEPTDIKPARMRCESLRDPMGIDVV